MSNGETQYAGFWRRWAAYTLDMVIVGYGRATVLLLRPKHEQEQGAKRPRCRP